MANKTRNAPPSPDGRVWTAAKVEAHALKCMTQALAYFRIPDHWETSLRMNGTEEDSGAEIQMDFTYLRGIITINTEILRVTPCNIWEYVAHEVAHLSLAPFEILWAELPEKLQHKKQEACTRAKENTVVQLTRMWLRDNPDPEFPDGPVKS